MIKFKVVRKTPDYEAMIYDEKNIVELKKFLEDTNRNVILSRRYDTSDVTYRIVVKKLDTINKDLYNVDIPFKKGDYIVKNCDTLEVMVFDECEFNEKFNIVRREYFLDESKKLNPSQKELEDFFRNK